MQKDEYAIFHYSVHCDHTRNHLLRVHISFTQRLDNSLEICSGVTQRLG